MQSLLLIVDIIQLIFVMRHVLRLSFCGENLNYKAIAARFQPLSSDFSFWTLAQWIIRSEGIFH